MSLDWNLSKIANHNTLCWREDGKNDAGETRYTLAPRTHTLIFAMMAIDIGTITEKNAVQVYTRIAAWESLFGVMCRMWDDTTQRAELVPCTLDDVRAHIGLRTNVTTKSDALWWFRVRKTHERQVNESIATEARRAARTAGAA
jgi:hypothetical protein